MTPSTAPVRCGATSSARSRPASGARSSPGTSATGPPSPSTPRATSSSCAGETPAPKRLPPSSWRRPLEPMASTASAAQRLREEEETHGRAGVDSPRPGRQCVRLGLIATPTLADGVVDQLAQELTDALGRRYPGVRWKVTAVRDRLTPAPVQLTELVDAARERLLDEDWQLAVCVTDIPLRLAGRPLLAQASPTHGIALISMPALGPLQLRRRLLEAIVGAVGVLVGDPPGGQRRLIELATDVDTGSGVSFLPRVISGNLLLLLGMIGANRPWRLVMRLSRALLGALAAAVYTL